jgi:hypothetical protein
MGSALQRFVGPGYALNNHWELPAGGDLYSYEAVKGQLLRLASNSFSYSCRIKQRLDEILATGRIDSSGRDEITELKQEVDNLQRTTFALFRAVQHTNLAIVATVEDIPYNTFEAHNFNPEVWPESYHRV